MLARSPRPGTTFERELWSRAVNRHALGEYRAALDLLVHAARTRSDGVVDGSARSAVTRAPGAPSPASPTFFRS